jgi:hypothetical protein
MEDVSDAYRIFSAKLDECIKPVLMPPSVRTYLHVHIVPEGEERPGSPDRKGRGRLSQYLPTKPISPVLGTRNA